jgi:hypothetical protein
MNKANKIPIQSYRDLSLAIKVGRKFTSFLIILTQKDPATSDGGIEHCVRKELAYASRNDSDILLVTPYITEINKNLCFCVSLALNDIPLGISLMDSLSLSLYSINIGAVIYHSLINFEIDALSRFSLNVKKKSKIILWLHDLSYVCESQILIRNNVFCSLQSIDSSYCNGCEFQTGRPELNIFYKRFISSVNFLIFPSEIAKERFFNYFNLPSMSNIDYKILPHYNLKSKKIAKSSDYIRDISIGFTFFGHNVAHKGWYKFLELLNTLEATGKFQFYHIGTAHHTDDRVKHIPFSEVEHDDPVDELGRLCMNHNIRLGFFWSTTLESFGMMLRQVLATQCAVLARGDDPALKEFIDDCDKIVYFDQFEDLVNFAMDENAVHDLLDKAANTVCTLEESEYSFSVLT